MLDGSWWSTLVGSLVFLTHAAITIYHLRPFFTDHILKDHEVKYLSKFDNMRVGSYSLKTEEKGTFNILSTPREDDQNYISSPNAIFHYVPVWEIPMKERLVRLSLIAYLYSLFSLRNNSTSKTCHTTDKKRT